MGLLPTLVLGWGLGISWKLSPTTSTIISHLNTHFELLVCTLLVGVYFADFHLTKRNERFVKYRYANNENHCVVMLEDVDEVLETI